MIDLSLGITFSVVVIIITIWIIWRKRKFTLLERCGIPGPKPNFWTGNLYQYIDKRELCVTELVNKYGKFVGFYMGAKPMVLCTDVEFLKIMQIKEFKNFVNKDLLLPDVGVPHKVLLQTLELLRDEEWKNMRSFLGTSFSTGKIKKMSPFMKEAINIFLKKIRETNEEIFDIMMPFRKLTFDIICKSSFGIATNVQNDKIDKFTESMYSSFEIDTSDFLPSISICFPETEPIPTKLRLIIDVCKYALNRPGVRFVIQTCIDIIESRKNLEKKPDDVLQSMLDAETNQSGKGIKVSEEFIIANTMTFMIAGYDNISTTLGYCTYFLATNPDVQEKVRAEINENVKKEDEIQYNDLNNFQYMDQVISETLRLFPLTFNSVNRVCAEDFKYKNLTIPKGAIVAVPIWTLHRDPAYWTDPEKFIPERFSPENRSNIDQTIYQPFGNGPRICIGMRLATTVIKFVLADLIRSFKIEIAQEGKELDLDYTMFIIRSKHGILIRTIPL